MSQFLTYVFCACRLEQTCTHVLPVFTFSVRIGDVVFGLADAGVRVVSTRTLAIGYVYMRHARVCQRRGLCTVRLETEGWGR